MLKISVLLFGLDGLVALAMGLRYLSRAEFLPYQAKATGRTIGDLDPALGVVVLAMIRVVGGGFLSSRLGIRVNVIFVAGFRGGMRDPILRFCAWS